MIYIKFDDTPSPPEVKRRNIRKSRMISTILFFIPQANPDYDRLIEDVAEWQVEIDPLDSLPTREIGKDINGKIIFIMPWGRNSGYWTDNNITLDYFIDHFKAVNIDKSEFEEDWNSFAKR